MTNIEVKEYLEEQKEIFSKTMAPEMTFAMHKAISALDKQIPKKPTEKDIGFGDKALSCPTCGEKVMTASEEYTLLYPPTFTHTECYEKLLPKNKGDKNGEKT